MGAPVLIQPMDNATRLAICHPDRSDLCGAVEIRDAMGHTVATILPVDGGGAAVYVGDGFTTHRPA